MVNDRFVKQGLGCHLGISGKRTDGRYKIYATEGYTN